MDKITTLKDVAFKDIYIGSDYIEIFDLVGASEVLAPAPQNLTSDIMTLKNECQKLTTASGASEFSLVYDTLLYRITVSTDWAGVNNYVIRQTPSLIYSVNDIGISKELLTIFRNPKSSGLTLVSGLLGEGKTATAAAILSDRINATSSMGVSIEDPIETRLNGRHGNGRCMQIEVAQNETYALALKKTMRMGAANMLISEIRDGDTAYEALKASINGMFVIATIHANSVIDAIDRMIIFSEEKNMQSKVILSKSLNVVINQKLEIVYRDGVIHNKIPNIQAVDLRNDFNGNSMAAKIANGDTKKLATEIDALRNNFLNNRGRTQ